jgi:uncharacterized protein (TIGR03435 family)
MRSRRLIPVIVTLTLALAAGAFGQESAFGVASVRPNVDGGSASFSPRANGQLIATNTPLRTLILRAYGLHDSQLIDAPDWTAVERFDIDARAEPAPPSPDALMPMLRTLLAQRFQLKVRAETRQLAAYVLKHARGDRRLGPQIRPTQTDCSGGARVMTREELMAVAKEGWPPCGQVVAISFLTTSSDGTRGSRIRVRRSGVTMPDFATFLQGQVGRPVVDQTGVEGLFDLEYTFAPQAPSPSTELAAGENVPPILVAIEEQLGLKLESERAQVPVLVVESVERPTQN